MQDFGDVFVALSTEYGTWGFRRSGRSGATKSYSFAVISYDARKDILRIWVPENPVVTR